MLEYTYVYSKAQVHKSTGILKALYCADATLAYTLCPGYVNLALIETVKDFMAVNHNVAVALLRLSNNRHSLYLLYQYNYIIEGTHKKVHILTLLSLLAALTTRPTFGKTHTDKIISSLSVQITFRGNLKRGTALRWPRLERRWLSRLSPCSPSMNSRLLL